MGCGFSQHGATVAPKQPRASTTSTGMLLDCGSGHTSVLWYGLPTEGGLPIRQLRRSKLKLPGGGNFKITDVFDSNNTNAILAKQAEAFGTALRAEIKEAIFTTEDISSPTVTFVGATGGLREALSAGNVDEDRLEIFRDFALRGLPAECRSTFTVIKGEEEAAWELAAAHIIYGANSEAMFPGAQVGSTKKFGIFSGGGSSMQVQASWGPPFSFPFSTWWEEIDEEKGASADAWKNDAKWGNWERALLAKIGKSESLREKFSGNFVLTAMNHVAATAAGFAETPITAEEAVFRLRKALAQFKGDEGEPYQGFVNGKHSVHPTVLAWYSSQPPSHLARVGAMHICRLAHVLEQLFHPKARLFAPAGTDVTGARLDCEWTLEAYARELRDMGLLSN
ncbi:hypothetical protein CYMTET_42609 [Cymbomonas tetramitiformis]|uniref:Uncharacterized protein n=1 Tax=Cymbomonas tetramitiformis TaxID=36881 RepID=A0AAE0C542_9CHLO|nr:hypothetical protein CYMTET_42609 [Cymbomonas tetramitiformis]|eukprot:gene20566-24651_t